MLGTPLQNLIQVTISTLTSILSLISIIYLIHKGKKGELRILAILIGVNQFISCTAYILEYILYLNLAWVNEHHLSSIFKMINLYKYVAICTFIPLGLIFWLCYSFKTLNKFEKKIYQWKWLLFIPGIICYFLVPATGQHRLIYYVVWENGSPIVYLGLAHYIFGYIGLAYNFLIMKILLKHIIRSYPYSKKRSLILAFSGFITMLISHIYYFETDLYQKTKNFNIDSVLTLFGLVFFYFAVLKYRYLNITPVAFPKMVDKLKESIIIIDADGSIAYFNKAFQENYLDCPTLGSDADVKSLTGYIKNQINPAQENDAIIQVMETVQPVKISGEYKFGKIGKHYAIDIQPLFARKDFIGQIITLQDITDHKNLLAEVKQKNAQLELANEQLRAYAATAEELAAVRERNRLAGDIHDSVGHTMTVLISLIGVCSLACDKDIGIVKQKLAEMMNVALKGHQELKRSVQGIMPETQNETGIVQSILSLARDFEKTGVKVDFAVDGDESPLSSFHCTSIYQICREALTNSLRHGHATHINILVRFLEEKISLYIFDNGIGCKEIKKNMGLRGMENRVREAGGNMTFGSDGELGFNIHVELPNKPVKVLS